MYPVQVFTNDQNASHIKFNFSNMIIMISSEAKLKNDKMSSEIAIDESSETCIFRKTNGMERMIPLHENFLPGPFDVICSRGKETKNHPGNIYFHSVLKKCIEKYSHAKSRIEKSIVVSDIIDTVRRKSPNGGFVKDYQGRWYEVGNHVAREKVGQSLRDLLHGQYKSSKNSKKQRRREVNTKMREDLEVVMQANELVSKRMKQLCHNLQVQGSSTSDSYLMLLMTQANRDMLELFKKDESLKNITLEDCSTKTI